MNGTREIREQLPPLVLLHFSLGSDDLHRCTAQYSAPATPRTPTRQLSLVLVPPPESHQFDPPARLSRQLEKREVTRQDGTSLQSQAGVRQERAAGFLASTGGQLPREEAGEGRSPLSADPTRKAGGADGCGAGQRELTAFKGCATDDTSVVRERFLLRLFFLPP